MAIERFKLPVCDVCGKAWLPDEDAEYKGISARQDPRGYDEARRADGEPPLRCGKCKAIGWDRIFTGDRRKKDPHGLSLAEQKAEQERPAVKKKCRHQLLHCKICHPEKHGRASKALRSQ